MKKIAFAALFVGVASSGLLACGGDDDSGDITFADSGTGGDGGTSAACNPVTQQGCADGEKCSWLVVQEDPFLGRTDCVPDGTVALGGACTEGTPGETTGYDDCAAGNLCLNEICRAICTIEPDTCGEGFACSSYINTFSDDTTENLGVCDPTCDPINQDCEDAAQGCYLQLFNGKATCARVATGAEELTQGDTCANDGTRCFLNGCAKGYGGFLYAGDSMPRDCTAFCTPVETYLIDPDGNQAGSQNPGADANGTPPHDCAAGTIGATAHQCRFFQSYFIDMNFNYLDYISDAYGFCTPKTADFGDCTKYSEEWFLAEYDAWVGPPANNDPMTWGDHITELCDGNPGCANGCAKVETLDALDTAYCEANPDGPACAAAAQGLKIIRRSLEKMWAEQLIKAGMATAK